jgi:hypothetical protein
MRSVTIVHDRANPRPWVAIDCQSGLPLLRLQNRDQLELMCSRLDWSVTTQDAKWRAFGVRKQSHSTR